jgi:RHS repeat-associated protein
MERMIINHFIYQRIIRILAIYYYLIILNQYYNAETEDAAEEGDSQLNTFNLTPNTEKLSNEPEGKFFQTDPMGYQDSMNLYQAFNMNPINFVDPMGEKIVLGRTSQEQLELLWVVRFGLLESNWKYIDLIENNGDMIIDPEKISKYSGNSESLLNLKEMSRNPKKVQVTFANRVKTKGWDLPLDESLIGYTFDSKENKNKDYFNRVVIARNAPMGAKVTTLAHEFGHVFLEFIGKKYLHEQPSDKNQSVNKFITKLQNYSSKNFLSFVNKWKIGKNSIAVYLETYMKKWVKDYIKQNKNKPKKDLYDYVFNVQKNDYNRRKNDFIDYDILEWIKMWNLSNK